MTKEELEREYYGCRPTEPYSEDDSPNDWANIVRYAEENLGKAFKAIAKLEKENAELKGIKDIATLIRANNDTVITLMQLNNMLVSKNQRLIKAKELLTRWVELFKPKGGNIPPTPIQVETEQFISEE